MTEELLEKIPVEKCWAITTKMLSVFFTIRGEKRIAPLLGKEEGFISPIRGADTWKEINVKIVSDTGGEMDLWVKETFNIPVEDAIGAAKFSIVGAELAWGPEMKVEIVEATPERAVVRWTKCTWWDRYEEFDVHPAHRPCDSIHQVTGEAGFKAINPKLTYKLTKAMPRGDPYCEDIIEFKEE